MRHIATNVTHLAATLAVTAAAVLAAFAIPLPAAALTLVVEGNGGSVLHGSGKEVDVSRKVDAFSVLRLDSSVDVHAHAGTAQSVTVHADDNIEPLVETVVEGDTLVVRVRKNSSFSTNHKMVVDVTFTTLTGAQQRGSGDLTIDKVTAPKFASSISGSGDLHIADAQLGAFSLTIAGSGDVVIAGTADEARYAIDGSGDVDARNFAAKKVSVAIAGSGDARVNATESIKASVAGSGDVTYSGHPHDVSKRVAGSGSIEAAR